MFKEQVMRRYLAVPTWLIQVPPSIIAESAKIIYATLVDFEGPKGIFPSLDAIAIRTGQARSRVAKDLNLLSDLRLVKWRQVPGGTSNRYALSVPKELLDAEDAFYAARASATADGRSFGPDDRTAWKATLKRAIAQWRLSVIDAGGPDFELKKRKAPQPANTNSL
jgi:hypothetical protein